MSDSAIVVTGVKVDDDELSVDEWFLADEYWEESGVGRGPLPRPGEAKLSSTISPGATVLVAMSVSTDGLVERRKTKAKVLYDDGGNDRELPLRWGLEVVPADQACNYADD
ncbi:hypothetical protein [Nocardioides daphniae]|uniref:Uncharacterized protein n=1 Tax=Nocardioides daphniae TaxID=402297 RepID=A0A4P7U957_9ACTN|nr:hypothetical protein [Nocardioides daphniae]QCC76151.1 hypothetical protein E2C04_01140 [Nocardioides daphniae]